MSVKGQETGKSFELSHVCFLLQFKNVTSPQRNTLSLFTPSTVTKKAVSVKLNDLPFGNFSKRVSTQRNINTTYSSIQKSCKS